MKLQSVLTIFSLLLPLLVYGKHGNRHQHHHHFSFDGTYSIISFGDEKQINVCSDDDFIYVSLIEVAASPSPFIFGIGRASKSSFKHYTFKRKSSSSGRYRDGYYEVTLDTIQMERVGTNFIKNQMILRYNYMDDEEYTLYIADGSATYRLIAVVNEDDVFYDDCFKPGVSFNEIAYPLYVKSDLSETGYCGILNEGVSCFEYDLFRNTNFTDHDSCFFIKQSDGVELQGGPYIDIALEFDDTLLLTTFQDYVVSITVPGSCCVDGSIFVFMVDSDTVVLSWRCSESHVGNAYRLTREDITDVSCPLHS